MSVDFRFDWGPWTGSPQAHDPIIATELPLSMYVADSCITQLIDDDAVTTRNHVRVSGYLVAKWLLINWWRLVYEPAEGSGASIDWKMSHSLPAIGAGYTWPPLTIIGDGERLHFREIPSSRAYRPVSSIRFVSPPVEYSVDRVTFEREAFRLAAFVVSRLSALSISSDLPNIVDIVRSDIASPTTAARRIIEALLGYDPDDIDPQEFDYVQRVAARVGRGAMREIAAAVKGGKTRQAVEDINREIERSHTEARIANVDTLREVYQRGAVAQMLPFDRGYYAARLSRDSWGFGAGPLPNERFAEVLALNPEELSSSGARNGAVVGLGARQNNDVVRFVLHSPNEQSLRFDLARIVADRTFVAGNDQWSPVTKVRTARQAFQRAFAAELLCPIEALRDRFPQITSIESDEELVDAAAEFNVSPLVVAYQLKNDGIRVADMLVA
jgi:hypothetical protein